MPVPFPTDPRPGRPRLLFVGHGESSHTHSWIDLLEGADFNVRLFATPSGTAPPDSWPVRTYVTAFTPGPLDPATRARMHSQSRALRFARRVAARATGADPAPSPARWLAQVVREWRPDIVHTFGLDSGDFYTGALRRFGPAPAPAPAWVLQTRGGSDLALAHLDPVARVKIGELMRACDRLLSDNLVNFRIARELGVAEEQLADIAPVPGTGGVDVDALAALRRGAPSASRTILWPKAYECPWSKSLPVFEALKAAWERIQPCEVVMLAVDPETRSWYRTLPAHMRERCHAHERIPRARALELMTGARVVLAPSLVDGVPNSMYEAMAVGAFPIVSPLDTIRPVVEDGRNVLFARNLHPEELAAALVRAMNDGAFVDSAARENLALVRRVADRREIRARVLDFYEGLAARGRRGARGAA
ncbi:MAG TPA: glycosyltransferase family 4 protein [Pyrinomonadaceae bacterium]|nr:glycosyltransferase family 4 protein [Pyrinomonadaceae bacterium]